MILKEANTKMTIQEIREQIVSKIAEKFEIDPSQIKDEDSLAKTYGAKSHDIIALSVSIQAATGVKVGYAQSRKLGTVGEWVAFIADKKA